MAEVYREEVGRTVICDDCGADYTDRPDTGGLVFQSKADGKTTVDAATLERVVDPLLAR